MDNPVTPVIAKQKRLDVVYKTILTLIVAAIAVAIFATFVQIYNINSKINSEVKQISAAQAKNRANLDQQNGVILGYLICIGTIQPQDRTPALINACVAQAEKSDTQLSN